MIYTGFTASTLAVMTLRDNKNPGFVPDTDHDNYVINKLLGIPQPTSMEYERQLKKQREIISIPKDTERRKSGKKRTIFRRPPKRTVNEIRVMLQSFPVPDNEISVHRITIYYEYGARETYDRARYRNQFKTINFPVVPGLKTKHEIQMFWWGIVNDEIIRRRAIKQKGVE